MAYISVSMPCVACQRLIFNFHPNKVPSLRVNGVRQPVCRECIERVNPMRAANGLEPITIPPGAYDPCEESEVWWDD